MIMGMMSDKKYYFERAKLYIVLVSLSISIGAGVGTVLCALYIHSVDETIRSYQIENRQMRHEIHQRFEADLEYSVDLPTEQKNN